MKKPLYLVIAFMLIAILSACGSGTGPGNDKDDDDTDIEDDADPLVGTWEYVSGYSDGIFGAMTDGTYVFLEDGTWSAVVSYERLSDIGGTGTWAKTGETYICTQMSVDFPVTVSTDGLSMTMQAGDIIILFAKAE